MTKSVSEEEDDEDPQVKETKERGFTLESLQDLCNVAKDLQRQAQKMDDDIVRAVHFSNPIDGAMTAFKTVWA